MWIVYALFCAVFDASRDAFGKATSTKTNPIITAWGFTLFGAILFIPLVMYFGVPKILSHQVYIICVLLHGILNSIAIPTFFYGIRNSDLSLSAPLTSITPILLLITSPIVVWITGNNVQEEIPSALGVVGVLITGVGIYLLNINERKIGFWGPLKSIFINKGSRAVLIAASIWSITITLDRTSGMIMEGEAMQKICFWGLSILTSITIFTSLRVLKSLIDEKKEIEYNPSIHERKLIKEKYQNNFPWWRLFVMGITDVTITITHMYAVSLTLAAYAIAVKRTSILFKVLWGRIFFKESNTAQRFFGTSVIVIGIGVLTLSQVFEITDITKIAFNIFYTS
jgi:uncharacterized membrane protein